MEKKLITGNEPAMPVYFDERNQPSFKCDGDGLTIRQDFAKAAMKGMLSACQGITGEVSAIKNIAECAVRQADALITALNQ